MKRIFLLPLLAWGVFAQTVVVGGGGGGLTTATFASPPSPTLNTAYLFTDASATGVCSGTGSSYAICIGDGATFVAVTGASTGLGDPGSNSVPYRNGSGTTIPATATQMAGPHFCSDAGSTDTYACNLSPVIASYVTGTLYWFKANTLNTGTATINFNGKGALTIKKRHGGVSSNLETGDILAGDWIAGVYDGTNFQMATTPGTMLDQSFLDTDGTLAANSDSKIATQKATKTYADTKAASNAATTVNGQSCALGSTCTVTATPSGVVTEALGGTGANNTVGSAGHVLRSNGSHYVDAAIQAGDVPTLNQNTSGTAANLSGTPALPNGTTVTTQSPSDNSTKAASTAYADAQAALRGTGNAPATHSVAFSATPTFTPASTTKGTVDLFEVGALTGNITSSTCGAGTPGQKLVFVFTQDGTGGRTVAMCTGYDAAKISPTAGKKTELTYTLASDGTTATLDNSSNDTQSILFLTERAAPGTPASGAGVCWPDSTDHAGLACKSNNSANIFKMILSGVDLNPLTGQVTNGSHITNSSIPNSGLVNPSMTIAGHSVALGGSQAISASDVGLGSVTNDAQTKAAIVPNTTPGAGEVLVGNAGGTAYAKQALSGSCTLTSAGVITCSAAPAFPVNPQTSTYQVLAADFTSCKTITVASGTFTITLVASGSQPTNGQCLYIVNYGSGVVTVARSGQNINGATGNLTLPAASATAPISTKIVSDGTNYFADGIAGQSAGGTGCTTSGTGGLAYADGAGGCSVSAHLSVSGSGGTTLTGDSSSVVDLSAASPTAGLKIPVAAGAAPTADGFLAVNSTTHTLKVGLNGASQTVTTSVTRSIGWRFASTDGTALSGTQTGCYYVPFSGTITSWHVDSKVSGSATFAVRSVAFASYTGDADFGTYTDVTGGGTAPTISSNTHAVAANLTSWVTAVTAGQEWCIQMTSPTTTPAVNLVLDVTTP